MAQNIWSWVLLALCMVSVTAQTQPAPAAPVGAAVTSDETVTLESGAVVHLSKIADVECNMEQVTSTESDGSVSAVLTDYRSGKSILLKSKAPTVCYVADIPHDMNELQGRYCENGVTRIPKKYHFKTRVYEERGEATEAELSHDLAEQCKGRRLVALVEVSPSQDGAAAVSEQRRCARTRHICHSEITGCHDKCTDHGWWWGSSTCHHFSTVCDHAQRCFDEPVSC